MSPANERPPSRLMVAGSVSFYVVAAIAMVLANKWVLNTTTTPLFFLLAQLVIAILLFVLFHFIGVLSIPVRGVNKEIIKGLAPLILVNVVGLSTNNYTLKYVDASFYQIARGLVLPFTVATSLVFLNARPSFLILVSCGIVTCGFFVGVLLDQATISTSTSSTPTSSGPSAIGIAFGIFSSAATALHAVIIKRSLDVVGGSALELAWYSNLFSAVVLAPLVLLVGEGPDVMALFFDSGSGVGGNTAALRTFLWGSLITGLFGFLICIASFFSIKVTSPITHMISSAVRGVIQSGLSVWLFHDIITAGRGSSIGLILIGSIYYTWVKNRESVKAKDSLPMSGIVGSGSGPKGLGLELGLGSGNGSGGKYEPVSTKDMDEEERGAREN